MTHNAPLYPVFLALEGRHCLVVGLGQVGRRKLAGLLDCGPASVLVLDTAPPAAAAAPLLRDARVCFARRACTEKDVAGRVLVFAAPNSTAENRRVAAWCRRAGVLCNCASAPEEGGFQAPAVARRPPLGVALSTGGASPALARRWRGELETWLVPRARMAVLMGRLRPLILALGAETGQNTLLFRKLAESPLQQWLERNETERCRLWLQEALPPALHAHLAELLHDLP